MGKFGPLTQNRETKYIKGKRLKFSDRLKLDERIYSDPYANMVDQIKENAANTLKRFTKVKSAQEIYKGKIQEKAATAIQRFYTGNKLKQQRAQLKQDILNAPDMNLETNISDVLRENMRRQTQAANTIQIPIRRANAIREIQEGQKRIGELRAATRLQAAVRRKADVSNSGYKEAGRQTQAATKIQRAVRPMIEGNIRKRNAASRIQAALRQNLQDPDIQARNLLNELIPQVEYRVESQRRAQQILRTMTPSTTLSSTMHRPRTTGPSPIQQAEAARRQQDAKIYENKVQKPAAIKLQAAIRSKLDRVKVAESMKQMPPDTAATKIQKAIKDKIARKTAQNSLERMKATQQIAGRAKALLTTKAAFGTVKEGRSQGKIYIANKNRVGKPLVVGTRGTLVGKKASEAAKQSESIKREFKKLQK